MKLHHLTSPLLASGLLLTTFACGRSQAEPKLPAPPDQQPMHETKPLMLEFTMTADGHKLHVHYTITNRTKASYWVRDVMIDPGNSGFTAMPTAIAVVRGSTPTEVRLVRGDVEPDSKVNIHYPPAVRALTGGEILEGSAEITLPLVAWVPYGDVEPLEGVPTTATLDVEIFGGTSPTQDITLVDGTAAKLMVLPIRVPKILHADAQPIPK